MRPSVRHRDQSLPDRIEPNVFPAFREFPVIADAVVEAIGLEPDSRRPAQVTFPRAARLFHPPVRKRREHVQVVRHDEKQIQEPPALVMVEPGGIQKNARDRKKGSARKVGRALRASRVARPRRLGGTPRPTGRAATFRRIDRHELNDRSGNGERRRAVRELATHRQNQVGRALRASRTAWPKRLGGTPRPTGMRTRKVGRALRASRTARPRRLGGTPRPTGMRHGQ